MLFQFLLTFFIICSFGYALWVWIWPIVENRLNQIQSIPEEDELQKHRYSLLRKLRRRNALSEHVKLAHEDVEVSQDLGKLRDELDKLEEGDSHDG